MANKKMTIEEMLRNTTAEVKAGVLQACVNTMSERETTSVLRDCLNKEERESLAGNLLWGMQIEVFESALNAMQTDNNSIRKLAAALRKRLDKANIKRLIDELTKGKE